MDKQTARAQAFFARKAAFHAVDASPATPHLLAEIERFGKPEIVAGYMPIRTEIDPLHAMTQLAGHGVRIGVPVIQGEDQPLRFAEWTPGCTMVDGPFGAPIPAASDWVVPQLIIAPLVGFDRHGFRLGYGGGFYDRTFELLRNAAPTPGIGFAYAAQELERVPTEPTDQPLDAVVTEAEVIHFSPAD